MSGTDVTMAGPNGSTLSQTAPTTPPPSAPAATPPASNTPTDPAVIAPASTTPAPTAPVAPTFGNTPDPAAAPAEPKPGDPKPADPKPGEQPLKAEDYNLKLPDGTPADDPLMAAFLPAAAESKLSKETAQALVDTMGPKVREMVAAAQAAPLQAWNSLQNEWGQKWKADADIGGDKTTAVIARLDQSVTQFAGARADAVREAFRMTGAGNNPDIAFYLNAMASRLSEGGPVSGGGPRTEKDAGSVLFPKTVGQG